MKRIIVLLLIGTFIFTLVSFSSAETTRKKVVKVRPSAMEETEQPAKTSRIKPQTIEQNEAGTPKTSAPPKAQPIVTRDNDEDICGKKVYVEKGPAGFFVAGKGGFAMPRAMAGLEAGTTLVSNVMNKTDLAFRLGAGYLKGAGYSAWSLYGDLFLAMDMLRSKDLPLTTIIGAGINYPVSVDNNRKGDLGFNVFLSLNYDIWYNGQIFVEGGYNTFATKDNADVKTTISGGSALVGYKHFFN
jgi:hypothetical protein